MLQSVSPPIVAETEGEALAAAQAIAYYRAIKQAGKEAPQEATKWELLESGFEKIEKRLDAWEGELGSEESSLREALRLLRGYLFIESSGAVQ